jgi:hypothetical protein
MGNVVKNILTVRTAEEERDEDDIRRGREPTRGGGSESSLVRR